MKAQRLAIAALAAVLGLLPAAPVAAAGPAVPGRRPDPGAIRLVPGYRIEAIAVNLSLPTTATFDREDLLVAESGFLETAAPRVLRFGTDGGVRVVAGPGLRGPVTGLLVAGERLYVSHRGTVSLIENGSPRDIVTGLPSDGDHQNNNLALGADGRIYLGQGTATNAGVVGIDNYVFGWLSARPRVHEVPCQDIVLNGHTFETHNPLQKDGMRVRTGAYKPFAIPGMPGEVLKGDVRCGGSIISFNTDGTGLALVAWGLRNPFGLRFDALGRLWATSHGADVRGSRNIYNDPDSFVQVIPDAWYGWPDFFAGQPVESGRFDAPGKPRLQALWTSHPPVTPPYALFRSHEGANGFAFSPGGVFGYEGDAFVAMFGSFTPVATGVNVQLVGYRVARLNMRTGEVADFASNRAPGPSYINRQGGFDRPSDVIFAADRSLYIVDWGASTVTAEGLKFVPQTGVIWRVYPEGASPRRPHGPIVVEAAPSPEPQRKPAVLNVPELYRMLTPELVLLAGIFVLVGLAVAALWGAARRRL